MAVATQSWEQVLGGTDEETAALILQFELEHAEVENSPTNTLLDADFRYAKTLWAQELKNYHALRNPVLAASEPPKVAQDEVPQDHTASEEAPPAGAPPEKQSEAPVAEAPGPSTTTSTSTVAGQKRKWGFTSWLAARLPLQQASSEHQDPAPAPPANIVLFSCVVCQDKFTADGCLRGPCLHYYCDGCLNDLFRVAMTDQQAYPPRCCRQTIPFEDVERYLDPDLAGKFAAKKVELDDPKPTYCHVPTCSAYINETFKEEETATCPECRSKTCVPCKQAAHEGDCEKDEAVEETMKLAEAQGWKRCPGCERLVELRIGCNHMTCLCKTQFCYVCRAPWKDCPCLQFDEARLYERAQEIVNRDGEGNAAAVAAGLRQHHECANDNHAWRRVEGENDCEICGDTLREYINRCTRCHFQSCNRCRLQRT